MGAFAVVSAVYLLLPPADVQVASGWIDTHGVLAARLGDRRIEAAVVDPADEKDESITHTYLAQRLRDYPCSFAVRKETLWVVSSHLAGAGFDTHRMSLTTLSAKQLCEGKIPSFVTAEKKEGDDVVKIGPFALWEHSPLKYYDHLAHLGVQGDFSLQWIDVVPAAAHACVQFDLTTSPEAGCQMVVTRYDASDPEELPAFKHLDLFPCEFGGRFRACVVGDVYYFLTQGGEVYCCEPDGKGGRKPMVKLEGVTRPVRLVVTDARKDEKHFLFSFDEGGENVEYFALARKPNVVKCKREEAVKVGSKNALEAVWGGAIQLAEDRAVGDLPRPK